MESTQSQRLPAVAVGKQSEVADLDEAGGQDMEQEAANELDRIELHDAAAVAMPGVPPAEAHLPVVEAEESSVGDGKLALSGSCQCKACRGDAHGRGKKFAFDHGYLADSRPGSRRPQLSQEWLFPAEPLTPIDDAGQP